MEFICKKVMVLAIVGLVLPSVSGFNLPTISDYNFSVSSVSDDNNFYDYTDDVFCWYLKSIINDGMYRTDVKPNINIISGSYSINDENVTLTLEVKGIIEDRGIGDYSNSMRFVVYNFDVNTSKNNYQILYCNRSCFLEYDNVSQDLSNFVVDGSNLSVTFSLDNTSETINSIDIQAFNFNFDQNPLKFEIYLDLATNIEYSIDIEITKPDNSLYVFNRKILPLSSPFVIGKIDIEFEELLNETGMFIFYGELYIDGELIATPNLDGNLKWNKLSFGEHTLKVIAFDFYGDRASDEMIVWKFF